MGKLGFYFDNSVCTGCRTCQVACKDKNRLDVGVMFREVKSYECGVYPDAKIHHYSGSCNHCENPACVAGCPTGAMYKAEDGTVLHDAALCIGCGNCAAVCPYGAPKLLPSGVAGKCDGCAALRAKGQNPACVDACLMRCLEFGDLDELAKKHAGEDLTDKLSFLPDSAQTKPALLINPKACAVNGDNREVII